MPVSIASVVLHVADIENSFGQGTRTGHPSATAFWAKALAPGYDLVHQDHNSSPSHPKVAEG